MSRQDIGHDADLDRLFEVERGREGPDPEIRMRVLGKVAVTLGVPLAVDAGGTGSGGCPDPGLGVPDAGVGAGSGGLVIGTLLSKPVAIAVVSFAIGSVSGAGIQARLAAREPSVVLTASAVSAQAFPVQAPVPVGSTVATIPEATVPPPSESSGKMRAHSSLAVKKEGPGVDAELAKERALLEMARTALGRGNPSMALEHVSRHTLAYPNGRLIQERNALRIQALMMAGRRDEALEGVESFRRQHGDSPLLPSVEAVVEEGSK